MLVIIDEREIVTSGYSSRFGSEGVASAGFCPLEFQEWVTTAADSDLGAVEAFLLGDCRDRQLYPKLIKERTRAPVIAMNETPSLEQTLDLFAAGVDDVVRKPIRSVPISILDEQWRAFSATAGASAPAPSPSSSAITYFKSGLAALGRATTKASRANFLTPVPHGASFDALNAALEERCRARQAERAGRREQTMGERLVADQAVLRALPE